MEQGGNRLRDALLAMALALTGCGGAPQAPEAPRKVLVVQPGAAADMAVGPRARALGGWSLDPAEISRTSRACA